MLAIAGLAFAGDGTPDPDLERVVGAVRRTTAALTPPPQVRSTGPQSVTITYQTRGFKVHAASMTGEYAGEVHDETGPGAKGFMLGIDLQKRGEANQAVTPQTLRRPYWETYLQVTPLAGSDRQLFWGLSYGPRTDTNLLARIRQTMDSMKGTP